MIRLEGARLVVVRHAPVAVRGICYGQSDVPTTLPAGEAADAVYASLHGASFSRIVTSPFERTRPVAQRLADRFQCPVFVDARVSELSFGAWEGRTWEALEAEDPVRYARWMERWRTEAPPDGESLPAFEARIRSWCSELAASAGEPSDARVLVVTHAGVVRMLRAIVKRASYEDELAHPVHHLTPERVDGILPR